MTRLLFNAADRSRLIAWAALTVAAGCTTTQTVTLGSHALPLQLRTACVVTSRIDYPNVDAAIQRSLNAHGVVVRNASRCDTSSGADVVVEHHEVWQWNVVIYLSQMDIRLSDPVDGTPIVSAQWKNSELNTYKSFGRVADKLFDTIFDRLAASGGMTQRDAAAATTTTTFDPWIAGEFVGIP